jgi:hypothetical protein
LPQPLLITSKHHFGCDQEWLARQYQDTIAFPVVSCYGDCQFTSGARHSCRFTAKLSRDLEIIRTAGSLTVRRRKRRAPFSKFGHYRFPGSALLSGARSIAPRVVEAAETRGAMLRAPANQATTDFPKRLRLPGNPAMILAAPKFALLLARIWLTKRCVCRKSD